MSFEQFGFTCRFSSLGTLICLWKPGVCSPHCVHPTTSARKANPYFSSTRELPENLKLQDSLVSQQCRGEHRAFAGELWSIGRKMLASEMQWNELCCQLGKRALPGKKQPQHKGLSTHYPTWVWKAGIFFSLCATSDTSFSHREYFEQDHFGKGMPTRMFVDIFQAISCHLIMSSSVRLWFAAGSRSPKLVQHGGVLQIGNPQPMIHSQIYCILCVNDKKLPVTLVWVIS